MIACCPNADYGDLLLYVLVYWQEEKERDFYAYVTRLSDWSQKDVANILYLKYRICASRIVQALKITLWALVASKCTA